MAVHRRTHIQPSKAETPMEPYEAYKIDFHLFETMFSAISPLAKNKGADNLAVRLFKVVFLIMQKNFCLYYKIVKTFFFLLVDGHER